MPRRRNAAAAFRHVQRQARAIVNNLRNEIRAKETELKRLKDEESKLSVLTGRVGAPAGRPAGRRRGGRINWRTVLTQLPKQFKASHIRQVRGLRGKRPSEIFAAITRWMDAGAVKRKARGLYERVS